MHFGLEAPALRPAQVHAQQHLGPVLGLGAAGAGMDGDDGVFVVVFPTQHHLQFQTPQGLFLSLEFIVHFGQGGLVGLFLGQFQEHFQILEVLFLVPPGLQNIG